MSATSSRRRQLAGFEPPARGPMGTTGQPKGPARQGTEVARILGARRLAAAFRHEAEMAEARQERSARLRRRARLALLGAALAALAALVALR